MLERAVTVEQKRLYNEIADTLDFKDNLYDQTHWGQNINYWVDFDGDKWEGSRHRPLQPVVEHKSCNTTACVAGWACLLSNYHPTIMTREIEDHGEWIPENIKEKITYNYEVMCNLKDMPTPRIMQPYSGTYRYMQMDDLDDNTGKMSKQNMIEIWGDELDDVSQYPEDIKFVRPDSFARELLNLDAYDSEHLFSGDVIWTGADIRAVAKGENIHEIGPDPDSEGYVD